MRSDKEWIELFEDLHKEDLLWFVLSGLISSDNFLMEGEELIENYINSISYLDKMNKLISKTNIPSDEIDIIKKECKRGIKMLKNECNYFIQSYEICNKITIGKYKQYGKKKHTDNTKNKTE